MRVCISLFAINKRCTGLNLLTRDQVFNRHEEERIAGIYQTLGRQPTEKDRQQILVDHMLV